MSSRTPRSTRHPAAGSCDVNGHYIAFHEFLVVLNDCDEACGVDRAFEGHFDDGVLTGDFRDEVHDEASTSCVRRGTWWLSRGTG